MKISCSSTYNLSVKTLFLIVPLTDTCTLNWPSCNLSFPTRFLACLKENVILVLSCGWGIIIIIETSFLSLIVELLYVLAEPTVDHLQKRFWSETPWSGGEGGRHSHTWDWLSHKWLVQNQINVNRRLKVNRGFHLPCLKCFSMQSFYF